MTAGHRKESRRAIRDLSPSERRADDEGMKAAIDAAREAVITIETAEDAGIFRKRLVAEALAAFAEAAEDLKLAVIAHPSHAVLRAIAADPATSGETTCPECSGLLNWTKDESNGHVHAQCETSDCLLILK